MFKNLKIGQRMGLSFGLVLLFIIGLIFIGLNAMNIINKEMGTIVNVDNVRVKLANDMIDDARESAILIRSILISKFDKESDYRIHEIRDNIEKNRISYLKKAELFKRLIPKEDIILISHFEKVTNSGDSAWHYQDHEIQYILTGNVIGSTDYMVNKAYPAVQQWITNGDDLIKLEEQRTVQRFEGAKKLYASVRTAMILIGIIAFVLTLTISVFLTLSITRPLKVSVDAAARIAANDLSVVISSAERKDELGILTQAFRQMVENLRRSVKDISEAVNLLGSSASQILAATTEVATGTAETATAINETSITVEEVQQAAKLSAQKAKNVADSALRLEQVFLNGQNAVDESVKSMNRINEQMELITQSVSRLSEQSQSIGNIIASVTDIADQSNLLAVNAAIEAAKAGEQGKGFVVVAQEIKNLAGQSKQATLIVRNILNDIQKATGAAVLATEQGSKAVVSGVKQSVQAGEAIRILAESSNEAVQVTTQIVASSQQQVVGMEQINIAMQNISQAGTETAISMVQTEKSAQNLHEMGQKLKAMVEEFRT